MINFGKLIYDGAKGFIDLFNGSDRDKEYDEILEANKKLEEGGKKLKKVEAGAQGEHKISRGYLPNLTYSNHWFNNEVLSKPIQDFLEKENKKTVEVAEYLSKFSPFSENGN